MRDLRALRILGIDPGSRQTGYGLIDLVGNQLVHVAHGTLKLAKTSGRQETPLEVRLHSIYLELSDVIRQHKPHVLAVEKVFFAKNAVSALKLGQARGAVILTGMIHALEIVEYSPSEVKQAVVGHGLADKDQVQRMVQLLVGKQKFDSSDASDGLALAICHAHSAKTLKGQVSGLGQALQAASGRRSKKRGGLAEALGITPESVAGRRRIPANGLK